jgi:hypothetical protein
MAAPHRMTGARALTSFFKGVLLFAGSPQLYAGYITGRAYKLKTVEYKCADFLGRGIKLDSEMLLMVEGGTDMGKFEVTYHGAN